jgi:uncharacterized protein (UPF0333 family)
MMLSRKQLLGNENGVTLLLSVLIVSAMVIITLTVSFFAIQELRASRSSTLSEPAIVAAETAGEQGIWMIKRNTFADTCPASNPTQINGTTNSTGSGASTTITTKCVSYGPAILELVPGEDKSFFLYDPNDINGNKCMNEVYTPNSNTGCSGRRMYKNIIITHTSGPFSVNVSAVTVSGNTFAGSSIVVSPGNTGTITIPDSIPGASNEVLKVTVSSYEYATVSVTTEADAAVAVYSGMPDFPTVDAEGCASLSNIPDCDELGEVFKRRINITVPR